MNVDVAKDLLFLVGQGTNVVCVCSRIVHSPFDATRFEKVIGSSAEIAGLPPSGAFFASDFVPVFSTTATLEFRRRIVCVGAPPCSFFLTHKVIAVLSFAFLARKST